MFDVLSLVLDAKEERESGRDRTGEPRKRARVKER